MTGGAGDGSIELFQSTRLHICCSSCTGTILKRKAGLIQQYSSWFSFKGAIFSVQSCVGEVSKPSVTSQITDFKRCGFWHPLPYKKNQAKRTSLSRDELTDSSWLTVSALFQLASCCFFFTYRSQIFWNSRQPRYQKSPPFGNNSNLKIQKQVRSDPELTAYCCSTYQWWVKAAVFAAVR